ncbi:uncharacterized protein [Macrobrachium rosenbergii]|uniref:uncharacterized protein n=1 Tax=Macrobrachium rosenbergii TaxID=79674 RepID=UPI0034D5B912
MRSWGLLVVFLCTLWKMMIPTSDAVNIINRFFALPHIPRANVEMVIPSAKSTLLCFGACTSLQSSCQGFVVNTADLAQPCTLLIDLNGTKIPAKFWLRAYVSRIIDGQVIHYDTTQRTWTMAVSYCAGLNKQLLRYSTASANNIVLEAMNPKYMFIGAQTDTVSTNSARDIYSNQLMAVNWVSWRLYSSDKLCLVLSEAAFTDTVDNFTPTPSATICMPPF